MAVSAALAKEHASQANESWEEVKEAFRAYRATLAPMAPELLFSWSGRWLGRQPMAGPAPQGLLKARSWVEAAIYLAEMVHHAAPHEKFGDVILRRGKDVALALDFGPLRAVLENPKLQALDHPPPEDNP